MTVPNSKISVDSIEAYDPAGPVTVSMGASVTGGTFTINGNADFSTGIVTTSQPVEKSAFPLLSLIHI